MGKLDRLALDPHTGIETARGIIGDESSATPMENLMKASLLLVFFTVSFAPLAHADEGYDAGYEWAEFNSIDDPARCYDMSGNAINNSPSFTEGCLQYLQDQGTTNDYDKPPHHDEDGESHHDNDR